MSLGEQMNAILSRWQNEDIRRRDASLPIWDLGRPGLFARRRRQRREAVAACRRELLTTLLAFGGPTFLMHHETPKDYEVPGNWQPAAGATWLVPSGFDLDDLVVRPWLDLGDWCFYKALGPTVEKSLDVFRCSSVELLGWMSASSVVALIESFHDDMDWVVGLSTG